MTCAPSCRFALPSAFSFSTSSDGDQAFDLSSSCYYLVMAAGALDSAAGLPATEVVSGVSEERVAFTDTADQVGTKHFFPWKQIVPQRTLLCC